MPLRPRHRYAAALPYGLPIGDYEPIKESSPDTEDVHRAPAHIRQI